MALGGSNFVFAFFASWGFAASLSKNGLGPFVGPLEPKKNQPLARASVASNRSAVAWSPNWVAFESKAVAA